MLFTSRLFAARSVGQLQFCTDELRLKCKNRRTSCYMRQRHCGYSFHHFLFFFRISYLFPSLSPLSLSFPYLSSSADGFSLGLWRRLHLLLSDLHNCIDEQCLFNNVTGRFFYMTSQTPHVFQISTNKACINCLHFLLYPYYVKQMFIMINYDRTYDISMHFCVVILLNFFISFLPWLMLYHNWITHHSTKFMVGSKYGRKKCIDQYDSFLQWRTSLDMMFELCI